MRKKYLILPIILGVFLNGCGSESKTTDTEKVIESSSRSESKQTTTASTNDLNTESSADSTKNESFSINHDIDININDITDNDGVSYTTPESLKEFVGSYKGQGIDDQLNGQEIQIVVNSDGTYRKLVKVYSTSVETFGDDAAINYGYFDEDNNFQMRKLSSQIGDKTFLQLDKIIYSQGVVVDKFDELYLSDLMTLESQISPYIDKTGEINTLNSMMRGTLDSYLRTYVIGENNDVKLLPVEEKEINEVLNKIIISNTYNIQSSSLGSYDQIKNGEIASQGISLLKDSDVDDVLSKNLEQLLTKEFFESYANDTNGLFQLVKGSMVGSEGGITPVSKYEALKDFSNIYDSNGDAVTDGFGYKATIDTTEYATIFYDGKVYKEIAPSDGKYILE